MFGCSEGLIDGIGLSCSVGIRLGLGLESIEGFNVGLIDIDGRAVGPSVSSWNGMV